MNDQQEPGPSSKSVMKENLDDFLRYFNIVRDDKTENGDEKSFDDQWKNDESKLLPEEVDSNDNLDFKSPEFN
ncbi:hypothetical protein BLA29_004301, partial [Euroglyphus maynei]